MIQVGSVDILIGRQANTELLKFLHAILVEVTLPYSYSNYNMRSDKTTMTWLI